MFRKIIRALPVLAALFIYLALAAAPQYQHHSIPAKVIITPLVVCAIAEVVLLVLTRKRGSNRPSAHNGWERARPRRSAHGA